MIYFISNQTIIENNEICQGSIQQMLEYCSDKDLLGLDIETTGFDPYTNKILCVQIGDKENQFVIDNAYYPPHTYKEVFKPETIFIGHNLKFDLRFLLHNKIVINNCYDTYIAEEILYNGIYDIRKSLDYVSERYTGEFLDKSIRGNIHKEGLSDRVIKYAADDVRVLFDIREAQLQKATELSLNNSIKLNNLFVPVIAYLEYCGFKLDTNLWQQKCDKDKETLNLIKKELDQFIIDNNITKFIKSQLELFSSETTTIINWNSSQQVVELFKMLGIDTTIVEDDEEKNSVSAKKLTSMANDNPLIAKYLSFKEAAKRVGTYGENWYSFINAVTKRIHTTFRQWVSTGRMSSGGKDKATGIKYPNAQNIPSDKETRQCIIADEGNTLINADYDGQETVVFANKCLDPTLLEMYDNGYKDMHSFNAWHIFPYIRNKYPQMSIETLNNIKKHFPQERQTSKFAGFAIQYGGTGVTIAENCNISVSEGERVYNNYFNTFKGVKRYFDYVYKSAKKKGYILFNEVTGSKYFIPKGLKDGKIKNRAYNYPIQATSSDITKYAGILYWRSLVERSLVFTCKIVIICHDEYLLEVPKELAEQEAQILKQCMEEAGDFFCKRVPLTATPKITPFWNH
jgi:DNA polymerase-1